MASLLANSQAAKGHHVRLVYSKRPESPKNLQELFHSDIVLENIQMRTMRERIVAAFRIRKLFSSADAIFLHSSIAGFIGRLSAIGLRKIKIFYIPHCISFMRKDVRALKRAAFIALEWTAAFKSAAYIACSRSEKKAIERIIPFRPCLLIENAVETIDTSKKDISETPETLSIVTVGQIRIQKNPKLFAEIANLLRLASPQLRFKWIGDGDIELKKALLSAGVEVLGWMPKNEVIGQLSRSHIYLSTSLWEGMPVSVIEAASCHLPVVAHRCAGNNDVIDHGISGLLFESPQEAVSQINSIVNDRDLGISLASTGHRNAQSRFTAERYIREFSLLLES